MGPKNSQLEFITQRFHRIFRKHMQIHDSVKPGDKERFDKEQMGVKEPFPVTNCQLTS